MSGGVYYFKIIRTGKPGEPAKTMNLPLCICHHHRAKHSPIGNDECTQCNCQRFNEVSRKSKRVYQRGSRTDHTMAERLVPGIAVLVEYDAFGELVLATKLTHAFLATVEKPPIPLNVAPRARREWAIQTDLGVLPPTVGITPVTIIRNKKARNA